ncbi:MULTISPECIES: quinone-dependent dihydroorotate dehydrogenase [unclassified Roseitalea]|uniref:quinone-dependent dihydroorotate dehydrogenase n=1 Tax=unclassified Roseitalea TaxID=2639107 RepID=UPI00273EAF02|nr:MULTISPECIES: quinone-dependent dihydroorotate dehydrogenase [unclassified Roseitalea]
MALRDRLGRWLTFRFDPETAHDMAIAALKSGLVPGQRADADPRLAVRTAGLAFPNPVGVAAGFDKNAQVPHALLAIGFGFAEIGTVTPRPQAGNRRPRVFRLAEAHAVINRMGFNNAGHAVVRDRLSRRPAGGVVGVNIGANADSQDRIADYVSGLTEFYDLAGYFAVNISSPNTPGLRALQGRAQLAALLERLSEARRGLIAQGRRRVPIFVKIAPDLEEGALDDIAAEVAAKDMDGMIVSNTTLARTGLARDPGQAGGLSGRPLFERATIMLARTRQRVGPRMTLIGVGGVDSAAAALAKIEAGADLVELYTGMIYQGPQLAARILGGLSDRLDREGVSSIAALRDRKVEEWAARPLPGA